MRERERDREGDKRTDHRFSSDNFGDGLAHAPRTSHWSFSNPYFGFDASGGGGGGGGDRR